MKILLLFLNLTFLGSLYADCSVYGLNVFPKTETINKNSFFVLEGYARTQEIITLLNSKYPVYLESKNHRVNLSIKRLNIGMFNLTQAILTTEEDLIPDVVYFLRIDNLGKLEERLLTIWNSELQKSLPISWKIDNEKDSIPPKLIENPIQINSSNIKYGCGPAIFSDFKIITEDQSEIIIKTELVNLYNGESTTYFLTINDSNIVRVGHGMCSGAFTFERNIKYKVRFSLIDICGNENEQWTSWINFDSPNKF